VADGAPADAGAVVAICKAGEVNLGEGMVAAGWAQADRAAPEAYGTLEDGARAARRGLWTGTLDRPEGGRAKTE
jgi:endonuclease YncB( thermonuclease family)